MTKIKVFRDLLVWQKAHQLVLLIYKITSDYPKQELFSLVSQIRRSSISIAANIVEGFRRKDLKESIRFYNIADASLEETKYHLLLSKDLNYINQTTYNIIINLSEEVGRLLARWIQSQNRFL